MAEYEIINFHTDTFRAKKEDGDYYVIARDILRNIGFDTAKMRNQVVAWTKDIVISKGSKYINVITNGGPQECYCIKPDYMPLALAKISITPTMIREQPEVVSRLVQYQEECGTVLYNYFNNKTNAAVVNATNTTVSNVYKPDNTDAPLTREEMAMYFTDMMNTFKQYTNVLAARDRSRDKAITDILKTQADNIRNLVDTISVRNVVPAISAVNKVDLIQENIVEETPAVNKLLIADYDFEDSDRWRRKIVNTCKEIAPNMGYKDYKWVFRHVVNEMRQIHPEIDSLLSEYKKSNNMTRCSFINMFSRNKTLRESAESIVNKTMEIYSSPIEFSPTNNSEKFMSVPSCIKTEMEKLGKITPYEYTKVYRVMERKYGIDLMSIRNACSNMHENKRCSIAFAISQDEKILEMFRGTVKELLNEVA